MIKVVFLGQNPRKKNTSHRAFEATASLKTISSWIEGINIHQKEILYLNASDSVTPPLKANEPRLLMIKHEKLPVVAFGRFAYNMCKKYNIVCFEMPHPSGLNRKLNDKLYVKNKINELKIFIESL